jgi:hypothetical protein
MLAGNVCECCEITRTPVAVRYNDVFQQSLSKSEKQYMRGTKCVGISNAQNANLRFPDEYSDDAAL